MTDTTPDPDLITDPRGEMAAYHWADGGADAWLRFEQSLLCEVEP